MGEIRQILKKRRFYWFSKAILAVSKVRHLPHSPPLRYAMIFIIYIHLYKQMYTLHLSVVDLKKDHFEIYFIKCLYFTIKIHWTVAYIFSIDIDTVSSQKLNFLLGFISITMSNHAWSPMCMLLGGLFIRAYLSGKYTDKLQDNKNSFIIFFFFIIIPCICNVI